MACGGTVLLLLYNMNKKLCLILLYELGLSIVRDLLTIQGVSLAIGPKVFLITFKVIDVI
jgi:hypothetical protein